MVRVGFLLLPCGSGGLNSGCRVWWCKGILFLNNLDLQVHKVLLLYINLLCVKMRLRLGVEAYRGEWQVGTCWVSEGSTRWEAVTSYRVSPGSAAPTSSGARISVWLMILKGSWRFHLSSKPRLIEKCMPDSFGKKFPVSEQGSNRGPESICRNGGRIGHSYCGAVSLRVPDCCGAFLLLIWSFLGQSVSWW